MLLTVDPSLAADVDPAWVEQIVATVLSTLSASPLGPCSSTVKMDGEEADSSVEVSVTVGNDALLQELNQRYRGVDRPTDVLAFSLHSSEDREPFVTPLEVARQLGDVVISYPRMRAQACAYGHTVRHQLAYLLTHGVLHLVGYDHHQDEDFAAMRQQEERVIGQLGLTEAQ